MQAVCDVLEQLVSQGTLRHYAIGGATAAGFHGEPLATRDVDVFVKDRARLVYLVELPEFDRGRFSEVL
ncbi:MAG: hypothetical protein K9M97_09695 [Akkermansiaceae bacterium]|nr:hypothetical protein [Akkermansiaceae bacterium]